MAVAWIRRLQAAVMVLLAVSSLTTAALTFLGKFAPLEGWSVAATLGVASIGVTQLEKRLRPLQKSLSRAEKDRQKRTEAEMKRQQELGDMLVLYPPPRLLDVDPYLVLGARRSRLAEELPKSLVGTLVDRIVYSVSWPVRHELGNL